jgi:hypothetical protein
VQRLRAFENRALRRIYGPTKGEVRKGWRKLNSENLHIMYASQNIVGVIKSRRIGWSVEVVCTVKHTYFLSKNLKALRPIERSRQRLDIR